MRSVRRSWCPFWRRWASTPRRTSTSCLAPDSQVPTSRTPYLNAPGTRKSATWIGVWFVFSYTISWEPCPSWFLGWTVPLRKPLFAAYSGFWVQLQNFFVLHQGVAIYSPSGQFAKLHQIQWRSSQTAHRRQVQGEQLEVHLQPAAWVLF